MKNLHYTIVSEEMVWLWYYDGLGNKHIKELFARDARNFIRELEIKVQPESTHAH